MIKDFIINDYRGLQNLTLKDLNKINVFVGPNNCGKTSIISNCSLKILLPYFHTPNSFPDNRYKVMYLYKFV